MRLMCKLFKPVNSLLKEQKILTLEAPFIEEISGMAITKILDTKEQKSLP